MLNPHISVDCVIFGFDFSELRVLLVERTLEKDSGVASDVKLPGNLIRDNEDLDSSAYRILKEFTGLESVYLEQCKVFSSPDRIDNEEDRNWLQTNTNVPVDRVISVAYYSLIRLTNNMIYNIETPYSCYWYKISEIPDLPFDHNSIIKQALRTVRYKMKTEPLIFELLPKRFTIKQLQDLYEVIFGIHLDNRNFRKKIKGLAYIVPLEEKERGLPNRPAQYYMFDRKKYDKISRDRTIFL